MTIKDIIKFDKLSDRNKWRYWWSHKEKFGNVTWHCAHCGGLMENETPYRAQPFSGSSINCCDCDSELTRRTGGGQSDPFKWICKIIKEYNDKK